MKLSELNLKNKQFLKGDDCVYVNLGDGTGIKIIEDNTSRYHSLAETDKNLSYFKSKGFSFFPEIFSHNIDSNKLLIKLKHIEDNSSNSLFPAWIPLQEKKFLQDNLQAPLELIDYLNNLLIKEKITPEDEWCKKTNIISNKIVDFHRFRFNISRHLIPTEVKKEDCDKLYSTAVKRYLSRGDNKWKGKIYQGHHFSNGSTFEGYSSDGKLFDSYRKLNFYYLNKAKGKKVLDIGCNEGFFSTQAALAGAESVTAIDLCKEDILLAKDIRDEITGFKNIEYLNADAVDFVKNDNNKYHLTLLSSVLHQIYPNNIKAEKFMSEISSKTDYLCIESPFNHPLMHLSLKEMKDFLSKFFTFVRFLFAYDAYSSGYRAIFVCWRPK